MNFDKLYQMVLEAKGTKPGERYFKSQQNIGPMGITGQQAGVASDGEIASPETSAGYSSSPVGKVDSFETKQDVDQMKKYLYDPMKGGDQSDVYEMKAAREREMATAFAILFNSKTFFQEFKEIYSGDKKRDYPGFRTEQINSEDEKEWNNALVNQQKKAGEATEARDRVNRLQEITDNLLGGRDRIRQIEDFISNKKKEKKNTRNKEKRETLEHEIKTAMAEVAELRKKTSGFHTLDSMLEKAKTSLINAINASVEADSRFEKINSEIENITADNKKSNDSVISLVKSLINNKASGLYDRWRIENDIPEEDIPDDINFLNFDKNNLSDKLGLLKKLKSENNPIFDFIKYHEDRFEQGLGTFDSKRLLRNINIGTMRSHMELPAQSLYRFFNSIAGRGMERKVIPLDNLDVNKKYKSVDDFIKKLGGIKSKNDWLGQQSDLSKMVDELPFNDHSISVLKKRVNGFWEVNRQGKNIANQLIFQVQSMMNEQRDSLNARKNHKIDESFDRFAGKYLSSVNLDINDLILDLQEISSYKK